MSSFKFKIEDYILYILNRLEPKNSDKIRLNKIAFFVEFDYLLKYKKPLSSADYAAINLGPVIDQYDSILKNMEQHSLVKIDGPIIRPLASPGTEVPEELRNFIDQLMAKYSGLNDNELIALSHLTDSYKITTDNEKKMGGLIDKKLALLETFLDENMESEPELKESELPKIKRAELVSYASR